MPKPNPGAADIKNLYKRQAIHLLLYGFISGVQWSLPSVSRKEAAEAFLKKYNLVASYSIDDVLNTYNRINKDLIDAQKTEKS